MVYVMTFPSKTRVPLSSVVSQDLSPDDSRHCCGQYGGPPYTLHPCQGPGGVRLISHALFPSTVQFTRQPSGVRIVSCPDSGPFVMVACPLSEIVDIGRQFWTSSPTEVQSPKNLCTSVWPHAVSVPRSESASFRLIISRCGSSAIPLTGGPSAVYVEPRSSASF